jgi:hypothetical protein
VGLDLSRKALVEAYSRLLGTPGTSLEMPEADPPETSTSEA